MMDDEYSEAGRSVDCRHCGAKMRLQRIKKHPGSWPYVLASLGLFFTFFIVGALIGIPMLLIGIYMSQSRITIRSCPECGSYYEVYVPEGK